MSVETPKGNFLFGLTMCTLTLVWMSSLLIAIVVGITSFFVPMIIGMRSGDIAGISFAVFFALTLLFGAAIWIIESGKPLATITTHTRTITTYR